MKKGSMALAFLAVICLKKHLPVWRFQVNVNCSQAWSVRIYLLSCLGKNSHFSGCPPFVGDSWKIHTILYFFMWELGLGWALNCVYPFDKKYNCFNPHHHLNHVRHKSLRGVWPESGRTAFLRRMRKHVLCAREISWGQCATKWGNYSMQRRNPILIPRPNRLFRTWHDLP